MKIGVVVIFTFLLIYFPFIYNGYLKRPNICYY